MIVVFSTAARDDIAAIGDVIAQHNRSAAARLTRNLTEACQALADMPLRYPLLPAFEARGIRRRPYRDYLIFYEVQSAVAILRVIPAAMDYERHLFPGG